MLHAIIRKFVKMGTRLYDPLADITIGTETIKIPVSHLLRDVVRLYPDYNFNLPRIITYVARSTPNVKVIDIGANVGDTVAFIRNYSEAPILCIDGEKRYLDILRANVAQYKNVAICQALVGENDTEKNLDIKMERGTAFVTEGGSKTSIRSLENILKEYTDFKDAKVLKVDTDGFDTWILRGCGDFFRRVKPVLFFEFDPYLITINNDNPFEFIKYLKGANYKYLIFYVNNGDYLLSCDIDDTSITDQLIHYFSGRRINMFADICAFHADDKPLFDLCVKEEIAHFRKARGY